METSDLRTPATLRRIFTLSILLESGTGIALLLAPALGLHLLIGGAIAEGWLALGRCFGLTLLALAAACWPGRDAQGGVPAFRGLLSYNGLIALYLGLLGANGQWKGQLLWPAVVLHALVALALLLLWRRRPVRS